MKNKMDKRWVTISELAQITGKLYSTIYRHKTLPYTIKNGTRQYDLTNKIVSAYINDEPIPVMTNPKKKKESKESGKNNSVLDPKNSNSSQDVQKLPAGLEIPEDLKKLSDSGDMSFNQIFSLTKTDLEKIKIYEQIKDIKSKAEERRDMLVDRKLVRTVFSKIYEIDMNQFTSMKTRLITDLASIFEVKDEEIKLKAAEHLDNELWKILSNIKRELNKFLGSIGEDEVH